MVIEELLEKINFENPRDIDMFRLQHIIEDCDLIPAVIRYRFSKVYDFEIKIVDGKLVLGYTVRYKRPGYGAVFTSNYMIVFESMNRFIMKDKLGVVHGFGKDEEHLQDPSDIEYRKWISAKKIADCLGLTYIGDGIFERVQEIKNQ